MNPADDMSTNGQMPEVTERSGDLMLPQPSSLQAAGTRCDSSSYMEKSSKHRG